MIAKVTKLASPPEAGADWTKPPWKAIPSELIRNYMGKTPAHFPKTEVKIAYNDLAIYVMFRVEDRYVRATAAQHQESVCGDSCVEFFFTPGTDVSKGYYNVEMNCADNTSHPHWLTWSPVDYPKPNFHLPQSFGFLEFE